MNLWGETAEKVEEFIAVARDYLFEVVVIVVAAIRLFIGAFQRWNPVQVEDGVMAGPKVRSIHFRLMMSLDQFKLTRRWEC